MCNHYYEYNNCSSEAKDIALQKLEKLLPYCKMVLLNGYGEPFISRHFLKCLRLLQKYQVKAFVTTNLSVLTDEMCKIIPVVFEEINVSCNGYDKKSYEKIHRGLKYEVFSANLSKLLSACGSTKVSLSCVAMLETLPHAQEFIRFAHEKGIEKVRFGRLGVNHFIRNYDQDPFQYPQLAAYHMGKAKKLADAYQIEMVFPENYNIPVDDNILANEIQKADQIVFHYDGNYQKKLRDEFMDYYVKGIYGHLEHKLDTSDIVCYGICDWVAKGVYIDTQGDMYPCCESKYAKYGANWNGAVAKAVRNEFYTGRLPDFCKNCPFIINNELKMLKCDKGHALYRPAGVIPIQ